MVCKVDGIGPREGVVLIGHHPISVFTTTTEHIDRLQKKPDGHYERKDLMTLVNDGHAVLYDEKAVRAIARACEALVFGCHPA
jgi:hypothetical protein